jgi:hypothetical protein
VSNLKLQVVPFQAILVFLVLQPPHLVQHVQGVKLMVLFGTRHRHFFDVACVITTALLFPGKITSMWNVHQCKLPETKSKDNQHIQLMIF